MEFKTVLNNELIAREVWYRTSRSSGPGGQNVNKTETRVELLFDLKASEALTNEQKDLVGERLGGYITKDGMLVLSCSTHRSQLANKKSCFVKLLQLLEKALEVKPQRVKTKPSKASKETRLKNKVERSEVKQTRRWRFEGH